MTPAAERPEILAFEDEAGSLGALVDALTLQGYHVDVARDLDAFRDAFVAAGGHRLAILGGGVPDAIAARAASVLHAVDPSLRVVVFGHDPRAPGWPGAGVVRLAAHHPAARSALGAVLRVLTTCGS